MGQMLITFYSPEEVYETFNMIKRTILSIGGKIKREENGVIIAKWKNAPRFWSSRKQFTFYVGKDMVRVVANMGLGRGFYEITEKRGFSTEEIVWNTFVERLCAIYPEIDFGIRPGVAELSSVKITAHGKEQIFTSVSKHNPSLGNAILGGMLFGTEGAIIGSMTGTSRTTTSSTIKNDGKIYATVRYTNGLTHDGVMLEGSPVYHKIMANMSLYNF